MNAEADATVKFARVIVPEGNIRRRRPRGDKEILRESGGLADRCE